MVCIFKDLQSGEYVIQTTCLTPEHFITDLAEALSEVVSKSVGDGGLAALGVLQNAIPIAFKLTGYKAETVSEQRTLMCGLASPVSSDVIATAGR